MLFSCNGQDQNKKTINNKTTETSKMQNINIKSWKEKAVNYMKHHNEDGENITLDPPYYLFKEVDDHKKLVEFSGDDKDGYSLKETLPDPNIYNDIKFYRPDGSIQYTFRTLIVNPNIVVGEHIEYSGKGEEVKKTNYDEGFQSSPEKIIKFIESRNGSIKNELTIIDRERKNNISTWHIEFLNSKEGKVNVLTLEDHTLKILKSEERDSDFLQD